MAIATSNARNKKEPRSALISILLVLREMAHKPVAANSAGGNSSPSLCTSSKIQREQTQMPDVTSTFKYLAVEDGAVREQLFAIRTNRGEKNVGVRFTTRYGGAKIVFAATNAVCTKFGFSSNAMNL
jgi:hypothetical protein